MVLRGALLCAGFQWALGLAFAQPPQPGQDPLGEHLFPPELIMQHQNAIGLSEEQKGAIRGEIVKAQTRFLELQWQLQDAMEGLLALVKQAGAEESEVMARLEKVLAAEREVKRTQLALLIRIKNRLSAEQQARLRELRLPPQAR